MLITLLHSPTGGEVIMLMMESASRLASAVCIHDRCWAVL